MITDEHGATAANMVVCSTSPTSPMSINTYGLGRSNRVRHSGHKDESSEVETEEARASGCSSYSSFRSTDDVTG